MNRTPCCLFLLVLASFATRPAVAEPIAFTNFGNFVGVTVPGTQASGTAWYASGPFTWTDNPVLFGSDVQQHEPLPEWKYNSRWEYNLQYTAGWEEVSDGIIRAPMESQSTIFAYASDGTVIGTLELEGEGRVYVDMRPENATVVDDGGVFIRAYANAAGGYEKPMETYRVVDGTGIYANLRATEPWSSYVSGNSIMWRDPNIDLEANFSGTYGFASTSPSILTGSYEIVPEPCTFVGLILGLLLVVVVGRRPHHGATAN